MTSKADRQSSVRVGFIGAGNWAEYNHMPTLKAREDVELVGIATPTQQSRDRVQTNFGIPFATPDYRELLEQPLDAVVISSPHGFHYEQATARIRNYSIFLIDRILFSYFEVTDLNKAMAMLSADPDNQRWQEHMAHMFDIGPGISEGATVYLEEVFHVD